jgi:hypothetical protein
MKNLLLLCALLVAILNALRFVPAADEYATPIAAAALALAVLTVGLAVAVKAQSAAKAPAVAAPPPAAPAANQAEAEIVAFLGLLQEKGRFVDFVMEDITAYDDSQVAAGARVVHQGCREVLREHFEIGPVAEGGEGAATTVPAGYAPDEYRLLGKISGEPPFSGTLVHHGWKTESVKLPRIVKPDERRLPAIAPAEVELS